MSEVALTIQPERKLFRPSSSRRYLLATLAARRDAASSPGTAQRVAIVVDTSRSMEPFEADARKAVKSIVETLADTDEVAFLTYDNEVRVVQPLAACTPDVVRRINAAAKNLHFAAGSRFRKGWLSGCMEIAETKPTSKPRPSHCWMISDGGGITSDVVSTARDLVMRTGMVTSVVSPPESRLQSFARLAGGKLHDLRGFRLLPPSGNPLEPVALEIEVPEKVLLDVLGPYRLIPSATGRWRIEIEDMRSGEARHVVLRLVFRDYRDGEQARITVTLGDDSQAVRFRCASHAECDREVEDPHVRRLIAVPRAENLWRIAQGYERGNRRKKACAEVEYARRILTQSPDAPGAQELLEALTLEASRLYDTPA